MTRHRLRAYAVSAGAIALLNTAYAIHVNENVPDRVNRTLAQDDGRDQGNSSKETPVSKYHDQIVKLWSDHPDVLALLNAKPDKSVRMLSAGEAIYPTLLQAMQINGSVTIAYVVGIDGRVDDARVLETSAVRFNQSAVKAVRQSTFVPALGKSGPVREILVQTIMYWWSNGRAKIR